jgi:hypothetical protein
MLLFLAIFLTQTFPKITSAAEWKHFYEEKHFYRNMYYDNSSIKLSSPNITTVIVLDTQIAGKPSIMNFKNLTTLYEIDCQSKNIRIIEQAGELITGQIITNKGNGEWRNINSSMWAGSLFKVICGKKKIK